MLLYKPVSDRKPQACSSGVTASGRIRTIEAFEYMRQILGRYSYSRIANLEHSASILET